MSKLEKLKIQLAEERLAIENLEQKKEAAKRDFERTLRESNGQIRHLEEKKKSASKHAEHFRREMEPFLYDLGSKVEQLRLQEAVLRENYQHLDGVNGEMEKRQKQIREVESLSRAMNRSAWTQFLFFSGSMLVLFVSAVILLLR
jgi:DNA repair exonuclease SbcCD ATPase subunit